jgi:hypothetical protein
MHRKTLLALSIGTALGVGLPAAYGEDGREWGGGDFRSFGDGDQDGRSGWRDRGDFRSGSFGFRRILQDASPAERAEIRGDLREIRQDERALAQALAERRDDLGDLRAAARSGDRDDFRDALRDLRRSTAEVRDARQELWQDRRELRSDLRDLRRDLRDERRDFWDDHRGKATAHAGFDHDRRHDGQSWRDMRERNRDAQDRFRDQFKQRTERERDKSHSALWNRDRGDSHVQQARDTAGRERSVTNVKHEASKR